MANIEDAFAADFARARMRQLSVLRALDVFEANAAFKANHLTTVYQQLADLVPLGTAKSSKESDETSSTNDGSDNNEEDEVLPSAASSSSSFKSFPSADNDASAAISSAVYTFEWSSNQPESLKIEDSADEVIRCQKSSSTGVSCVFCDATVLVSPLAKAEQQQPQAAMRQTAPQAELQFPNQSKEWQRDEEEQQVQPAQRGLYRVYPGREKGTLAVVCPSHARELLPACAAEIRHLHMVRLAKIREKVLMGHTIAREWLKRDRMELEYDEALQAQSRALAARKLELERERRKRNRYQKQSAAAAQSVNSALRSLPAHSSTPRKSSCRVSSVEWCSTDSSEETDKELGTFSADRRATSVSPASADPFHQSAPPGRRIADQKAAPTRIGSAAFYAAEAAVAAAAAGRDYYATTHLDNAAAVARCRSTTNGSTGSNVKRSGGSSSRAGPAETWRVIPTLSREQIGVNGRSTIEAHAAAALQMKASLPPPFVQSFQATRPASFVNSPLVAAS